MSPLDEGFPMQGLLDLYLRTRASRCSEDESAIRTLIAELSAARL